MSAPGGCVGGSHWLPPCVALWRGTLRPTQHTRTPHNARLPPPDKPAGLRYCLRSCRRASSSSRMRARACIRANLSSRASASARIRAARLQQKWRCAARSPAHTSPAAPIPNAGPSSELHCALAICPFPARQQECLRTDCPPTRRRPAARRDAPRFRQSPSIR